MLATSLASMGFSAGPSNMASMAVAAKAGPKTSSVLDAAADMGPTFDHEKKNYIQDCNPKLDLIQKLLKQHDQH